MKTLCGTILAVAMVALGTNASATDIAVDSPVSAVSRMESRTKDAHAHQISPAPFAVRNEGCVRRVDAPKRSSDWDIGPLRDFCDATRLIQTAIDEVFKAGGGRVDVGRGFYPIRGIRLRSGVTLHLESGAILQASRDSADFDILGRDSVEPVDAEAYRLGRTRGFPQSWTRP